MSKKVTKKPARHWKRFAFLLRQGRKRVWNPSGKQACLPASKPFFLSAVRTSDGVAIRPAALLTVASGVVTLVVTAKCLHFSLRSADFFQRNFSFFLQNFFEVYLRKAGKTVKKAGKTAKSIKKVKDECSGLKGRMV